MAPGELFERVAAIATTAEAAGFDTVMVMDHFYQLPMLGPPEHEMFEAYTLLLDLGLDGIAVKRPAEGHDLDAVAHGGEVLAAVTRR